MNAQNAKLYLPLVQALADGKQLQLRVEGEWIDLSELDFRWPATDYRIKPEPRKLWVVYRHDGRRFDVCDSEKEAYQSMLVLVNGTISKFQEVV